MSNLLKQLQDADKELGLTEAHNRTLKERIEYVETQQKEIKAVMWRLRVDLVLNGVIEAKGDDQVEEQLAKSRTIKSDLRQMAKAVDALAELATELKALEAK